MLGQHHAIDVPQSTEYAKEMRKWESQHSKYGPPGRPYKFEEFPKRMYKAAHVPGKGTEIAEALDANDALEEQNLLSRGFHSSLQAAADAVVKAHQTHGELAAERNFEIAHGRISEGAAKEVREAEEAFGARHLPSVPVTPKNRGGRPKKKAELVTDGV